MGMAVIVHGGAGAIEAHHLEAHREGTRSAAQIAWDILQRGGSALDAVEAAVIVMEDNPVFDAGIGAFLDREGKVSLDASIMDGRTLDAGAVAGVEHIKNPIVLARRVLASEHTFLIGRGAEEFAREHNIALIDNTLLRTPEQIAIWEQYRAQPPVREGAHYVPVQGFGTVGCVAVDRDGNIAAGTSTGGTRFKRPGRVGDSPLIGAGVYADNTRGGASSTGWGETITRVVLAKHAVDVLASGCEPRAAARLAIEYLARRVGGTGGIILADLHGRIGFAFNTPRMARAYIVEGMSNVIAEV